MSMLEKDPHGIDPHTPGAKSDLGKTRVWLFMAGFARALFAVADVTTKGAVKYSPNGWAEVVDGKHRYMEAFARHALALGKGEEIDFDTGCLHKAQMIWNLTASLELELREAEAKSEIVNPSIGISPFPSNLVPRFIGRSPSGGIR